MNTAKFKQLVEGLMQENPIQEQNQPSEKNVVDTKAELQKYFRDLSSITVPKLNGADSKEIQSFATIIKAILDDLGRGSVSPTLQQLITFYDGRTKNLG